MANDLSSQILGGHNSPGNYRIVQCQETEFVELLVNFSGISGWEVSSIHTLSPSDYIWTDELKWFKKMFRAFLKSNYHHHQDHHKNLI